MRLRPGRPQARDRVHGTRQASDGETRGWSEPWNGAVGGAVAAVNPCHPW